MPLNPLSSFLGLSAASDACIVAGVIVESIAASLSFMNHERRLKQHLATVNLKHGLPPCASLGEHAAATAASSMPQRSRRLRPARWGRSILGDAIARLIPTNPVKLEAMGSESLPN